MQTFLVKMFLISMEGGIVDDHVIRSSVRLVHPMVLRNVFSMALDEMNKVYDLDSKVGFFYTFTNLQRIAIAC